MLDITLEKIDLIRERSGISYRKAIEVLEEVGGDLIQALMLLEDEDKKNKEKDDSYYSNKQGSYNSESRKLEYIDKLRNLLNIGSRYRIKIVAKERKIVDFPLSIGAATTLLFPKMTAWGVLGLLLTRCSIELDNLSSN